MDELTTRTYREYIGEIPLNTLRNWNETLMKEIPWEYVGWSGAPKEPYRHWAAYPELKGVIKNVWEMVDFSFREDGFNLKPERVIANLFAHGDSSWIHRDCDSDTAWTAIIYLNDRWDIDWGGETVIVDNGEIVKSFAATPGKFILFKSNLLHGPRPVSREAPYPRFGLTFQCESNIQGFAENPVPSISATKF